MNKVQDEPISKWRAATHGMTAIYDSTDWSATPLGPRSGWSDSLQRSVEIILSSAFPMALRWGPDFVILYNEAYRPILGDKHPAALGRPIRDVWPEVWPQIEPAHIGILDGTEPSIFAEDALMRIQRHGSLWEDARFTLGYSPVRDDTAPTGVGGVLVTAVETTDKFLALSALEASEERYALALGAASAIGTWDWDLTTNVVTSDAVFAAQYSVDPKLATAGAPIEIFFAGIHPDDRDYVRLAIEHSIASGTDYRAEYRLVQGDGSATWVFARGRCQYDAHGKPTRFPGATVDITDRKAVEAELTTLNATLEQRVAQQAAERDRLWQTSQDLLAVVDANGIFTAANPAWADVLGWSPSDVIGRNHLDFIHEDDRVTSQQVLDRARAEPIRAFENRCLHKDGSICWISWVASSDNGIVYAIGRNITAAKTAEAELAATQEALRQSQKMEAVGQLTGGIAHDFNNMLAVVMGSLELLGRRLPDDERSQRYIGSAMEGARRAALLTQRLLAFSRQQPLQPETIDPNRLVAGMSDLLRHSLGSDVQLETVLAGGVWRTHADPNQLENVILNLAVNARDAMPDGGRLTIETQNAHLDDRYAATVSGLTPGQYVLIAVTDTGSGMSDDVLEKAFDPFFTTKAVGKGTGLGLSQVYGFVRQSGGHVRIYTEVGHGTTIKIYLPRMAADEAAQTGIENTPLALGELRDVVLVVEDEPAVRHFSVEALNVLGYRVLEADGPAAALDLLDAHPEIVLLFSDVVMPEMNGARLAEEARRRRPDLKVLFTTGYTRDAVVHNGVLDPGVDLIGKPFTLDALATKLRSVLEKP